jgi:hypothetical protein
MSHKQLFLSHYSKNASEVRDLATALRLHGIVPWIDKDGGFQVGDDAEPEARRAIREDCFGLLFYATRAAFSRWFIKAVEVDEALKVRATDPSYLLFAVPRHIGFGTLSSLSERHFGCDLSAFHTFPAGTKADLKVVCDQVAAGVVEKVLSRATDGGPSSLLSLQFSTREVLPDRSDDLLRIDATAMFRDGVDNPDAWERVVASLVAVKERVSRFFGRPRVRVNGSKHLTSAFLFGRVFERFSLDIRQTPTEFWCSDAAPALSSPFKANLKPALRDTGCLIIEIASGYKSLSPGVDAFFARSKGLLSARLRLQPATGPLRVDEPLCRAMVDQAYSEIERAVRTEKVGDLHLFMAAPQAFAMMLGQRFRGMPPVQMYEWMGTEYLKSARIPGGVVNPAASG